MKIAVGSDHRGYEAKRKFAPYLQQLGHEVEDYGCDTNTVASDYPDFALAVGRAVTEGRAEVGVLFDNSGLGMSIAANKVRGVRAALAHDEVTARIAREHNHCNVLCLGCDLLNEGEIRKIIQTFLSSDFSQGRHLRRIEKLRDIEKHLGA
jgi:ribose 5-phosphate isomerase B